MRICKIKATKRIIEMQSHAAEGTLLQNAINSGFSIDDVEELEVDEAGYEAAKAEDPVEIAAKQALIDSTAAQLAKAQAIIDNLPSWSAVGGKFDTMLTDAAAATNLAQAKAVLTKLIKTCKKIARVTYWDIKNTEE